MNELARIAGDLSWLGGVVGGLGVLFWLVRKLAKVNDALDKIAILTTRELSHNGGHSTKDYAAKGFREARKAQRQVAALETRFNDHLQWAAAYVSQQGQSPTAAVVVTKENTDA